MRFTKVIFACFPALAAADFYIANWVGTVGMDPEYGGGIDQYFFQFASKDACDTEGSAYLDGNNYTGNNPCNSNGDDPLTLSSTGDGTWDLIVDNTGAVVGTCTESAYDDIEGSCVDINYSFVVNSRVFCSTAYCVG